MFYNDLNDPENYYLKVSSNSKNVFVRKDEVTDGNIYKTKHTIDLYNQHWKDGTLKELKTELPQLVDGDKRHSISVSKKNQMVFTLDFSTDHTHDGINLHPQTK